MEELARRIGRYHWWESTLAEAIGEWALRASDPALQPLFAAHAAQHAWHAGLWHERMPAVPGIDLDQLSAPGSDGEAQAGAALHAAEGNVARLTAAYRVVVPRLAGWYAQHRAELDRAVDAPTCRVLDLAGRDCYEQWIEGETALRTMLRTAGDVDAAAAAVARVERLMVP